METRDPAAGPPTPPGDALPVDDTTLPYAGAGDSDVRPTETFTFLAPPQAAGEIGRLGHYRVLRVLGQGGMGIVFKAEDAELKRPVSLKVVKPERLDDVGRQRFLREARAMAAVKHDHIVTIYQVAQQQELPYLAMEFLQGETLEHWLQRGNQPTVAQVLRIGREIALGLAAAHAVGMIHRDIKPGNIWLEAPRGRVKILDFGLARAAADNTRLTRLGDVVGTPAFMAPEQAQGHALDHRCDLFSLGCLLYRLCAGTVPFREKSAVETLIAVVERDPVPPRQLNPQVQDGLSDLVMKLLAKDPAQRPPTAQAVADELKALQAQRAASAAARPPAKPPPLTTASSTSSLSIGELQRRKASPWLDALPPWLRWLSARPALAALAAGIVGVTAVLCITLAGRARGPADGDDVVLLEEPADANVVRLPRQTKEAATAEPWIALFDGAGFTHWKAHPDVKLRRGWRLSDRLLLVEQETLKKKKGTPTDLYSELGDFDDFHLRLEAKYSEGAKLALYFRAPFQSLKPRGRAVDIGSAPFSTGRLVGFGAVKELTRPNQWFTLELIAQGRMLHVKVNDETVVETEDAVYPVDKGHFVFSAGIGGDFSVAFRKIEVKRLK
jgi:serine/threonine protein kinase